MKRVYWKGKARSYTALNHTFTQKKPFCDMTEEEAELYKNRVDFRVEESPKFSILEKEVEDLEEQDLEEEENEEENENDSDEVKKTKKIKKLKK